MQSIESEHGAGIPASIQKTHAVGDTLADGWVVSVCGSVRRNADVPVKLSKGTYRHPRFGHFDPSAEDVCEKCIDTLKETGVLKKLMKQSEKFSTPQVGPNGKPFLSFWIRRAGQ